MKYKTFACMLVGITVLSLTTRSVSAAPAMSAKGAVAAALLEAHRDPHMDQLREKLLSPEGLDMTDAELSAVENYIVEHGQILMHIIQAWESETPAELAEFACLCAMYNSCMIQQNRVLLITLLKMMRVQPG